VAVQIDSADWLEIERQLEKSPSTLTSAADMTEDEFRAFTDDLSGHWEGEDGLECQRRIRADWNPHREGPDE
jgi:hypothetical protein